MTGKPAPVSASDGQAAESEDWSGTTALVTDVERRKAVPIIRALGRAGVRVVGLSHAWMPLGRFSRYLDRLYPCADYHAQPRRFTEDVRVVCDREQPDVLFPLEDESLRLCLAHPESYAPARALLPSPQAFETARDKEKTMQAARQAGVPIPETHCLERLADAERLAASWEGEAVVKPRKSSGSRGMRFVEEAALLPAAYREVAASHPRPLVQERLPAEGAGLGVFALMDEDHEPQALFGHRRLREYPVGGGPSTLRKSYRDEALIEQSVRLLRALDWTGIAMVEYKIDARTGVPKLMEINPRFWGSIELAVRAGVNFPVLYHRWALGQGAAPVLDFPQEVYCRWLWPGDLLHFLANPNRFHLKPNFFSLRMAGAGYDILSVDDPGPMLGMLLEAGRKLMRGR